MAEKSLYIENFTDFTTSVQVGEYIIQFPTMPNKKDIVNYGLSRDKQMFRRTTYEINGKNYYASDLIGDLWTFLPETKKKEIFTNEWEYRRNGRWYYIDGKTIFINGFNYYFLNYFKLDGINRPQFWDSQWFVNLLLEDSFYHDQVLALMYVKGRRGGGTAPINSAVANIATQYKNSNCGLMNYNVEQARKVNFMPIRQTILKHPDFFLQDPYLTARGKGASALAKLKTEEELVFPDVNCNIYISATKQEGFDGTIQRMAALDEPYKWANTDPMITLEKNVLCVKDGGIKQNIRNEETGEIIKSAGLMAFVSSVDEINDEQIQVVNNMWDVCSPETATQDWCSTYGARRYFEPTPFGFKGFMDKFGFSDYKRAEDYVEREYENTLKNAGYDKAREFKRKNPTCIEDALTPSSQVCVFNFEILEKARQNAMNVQRDDPRRPLYGNLEWLVPYREVIWKPKPDIRDFCKEAPFCISGHPAEPNKIDTSTDNIRPMNGAKYQLALDPVDYNKKSLNSQTKGSKPAMTVKRLLDMTIDGDKFDEKGNPKDNGYGFETNRTVLTYLYRHDDIKDLWEDIAKILVYYGCPLGHERSTRSIYDFLVRIGFKKFILDSKGDIITEKTKDDFGIKTSEASKKNYFDNKKTYIELYGLAERHIELIDQQMIVRPETMTKYDLSAADMINETYDVAITSKYRNRRRNVSVESIYANFKI
jgi:hypothetical protein